MSGGSAAGAAPSSHLRVVRTIVSLKWHLLLGGLRGGTQQRVQTVVAALVSLLLGLLGMGVLSLIGSTAEVAADLIVVILPAVVLGLGLLAGATGVESTIDARHLATEPVTRAALGSALLAAAVVGPPALLAGLCGLGIVLGWGAGGVAGTTVVVLAVLAWWLTLVLVSRTLANLLGAVATGRFRQFAQAGATIAALAAWVLTQVVARDTSGWDAQRWSSLADVARWSPPGQLGEAIAVADRPLVALVHVLAGVAWLPLLWWACVLSTERLALSAPRPGGDGRRRREGARTTVLERLLPDSPAGAVAARTVRTKFRTPRQSVNTVTALVIGAGVFLLGPVLGESDDPRLVLVAGLLHFAVLFDGNNAFGMDGAPLWVEVAAGADGRTLVVGKVLSSMVVMALPAVLLPVGMAALTGGWSWLVAGWLVALGSVLAASGVAVASAAWAPVAMPDSPNPLAAGDTGQGCIAGLMLALCMAALAVVTLPVAAGVYAGSLRSAGVATVAAAAAPIVGLAVQRGGMALATTRLEGEEERLVQRVTPAR